MCIDSVLVFCYLAYAITKLFFCKQKSSCLQDSPPAADCFSGIIGIISLRRSVILPGDFFVLLEHYEVITYGIKKWGCHIVICYPHIGQ